MKSILSKGRGDAGITLAELAVTAALLVVVMTLAGQLFYIATQAASAANAKAGYTAQVAEPVDAITRNLMQATSIESASPYSVTFLINPTLGTAYQRMTVDLDTASGRMRMWNTNTSLVNTGPILNRVFTKSLRNKALLKPAFRYYGVGGGEITDMASVPSRVKSVVLDVVVSIGGRDVEKQQTVFLRNMFGY